MSSKAPVLFILFFIVLFLGCLFIVPRLSKSPYEGAWRISSISGEAGDTDTTPVSVLLINKDKTARINNAIDCVWQENGSAIEVKNDIGTDFDFYRVDNKTICLKQDGQTFYYTKEESEDSPISFLSEIKERTAALFSKDSMDAFHSVYPIGE